MTVRCLVVLFHYWLKYDLIYSQCYTCLCYALVYNVYDVRIVCTSFFFQFSLLWVLFILLFLVVLLVLFLLCPLWGRDGTLHLRWTSTWTPGCWELVSSPLSPKVQLGFWLYLVSCTGGGTRDIYDVNIPILLLEESPDFSISLKVSWLLIEPHSSR